MAIDKGEGRRQVSIAVNRATNCFSPLRWHASDFALALALDRIDDYYRIAPAR